MRRAFTLIELILVVAIMGILSTVMVPMFVGAMQEHRLRSATRTIVSAGRHAMGLAVISQREILIDFDIESATVTVRAAPVYRPTDLVADADEAGEGDDELTWEPHVAAGSSDGMEDDRPEAEQALLEEELVRELEGVHIEYVNLKGIGEETGDEGTISVRYYTNGRCTPYSVKLYDNDGAQTVIEVDALSSVQIQKM